MKNIEEQQAMKVSVISIIGNILLTILKLIAGIFSHSMAMISDAIHSLTDVFSTVIVMVGIKFSNKQPDKEHPYGHERLESVAANILAVMLFATGLGIGIIGIKNITNHNIIVPGIFALIIAVVSIISKEAMYWYTKIIADKINSSALLADAWHHRSDALSSIGSFLGILGSQLGYPVLDSIASIVICFFILKVSIDIFKDSIDKMIDKSCDSTMINQILEIAIDCNQVSRVDDLKTRLFGNRAYIDIEIAVNSQMTITEAHLVAEEVHDKIEKNIPMIKHCMVHVNPLQEVNCIDD